MSTEYWAAFPTADVPLQILVCQSSPMTVLQGGGGQQGSEQAPRAGATIASTQQRGELRPDTYRYKEIR